MKQTPEIKRVHTINLHDCREKVAEALSELEGILNYILHKNNIFLNNYFTSAQTNKALIGSFTGYI